MKRFHLLLTSAVVSLATVSMGTSARGQAQQSLYTRNQLAGIAGPSQASFYSSQQLSRSLINNSVPQYSFSQVNRGLFGAPQGGAAKSKPFSNFVGQGSTSPWLALSQPFSSPTTNYYSNVRPQLDQQRANQQMAARNAQLQRQLNTLAAQAPYDPTGSERMAPTGHAAAFFNYGGYYTPVQPSKGRR
jgi:hypothetical protein